MTNTEITAHFVGMHGLRIGERLFDKTQHTTPGGRKINKTGVVPAACRDLIAEGTDPETVIRVYRGETLCFDPMTVGKWADLAVSEGDTPIRFTRYIPWDAETAFPLSRSDRTARS